MKKMKVAQIGLIFDPKNRLNIIDLNLPAGTKCLSVSVEKDEDKANKYILWVTYLSPSDAFNDFKQYTYPWKEFHFSIVKCNCTEIEINEHKYIGDIDIYNGTDNDTYAVFYEIGATIKRP